MARVKGDPNVTACKTCNRAVLVTDVDKDGNCCFCEKPKGKG